MAQIFDCPSCGASLAYDGDDDLLVQCTYCGSTVVVPEEIQRRPVQQAWSFSSSSAMTTDLRGLVSQAQEIGRVKDLARGGRPDEAVRLLRETLGVTEEEANELVSRLAAGQSVVIRSDTSSMSIPVVSAAPGQSLSGEQRAQMLWALDQVDQAQQGVKRGVRTALILGLVIFVIILAAVIGVILMANPPKLP